MRRCGGCDRRIDRGVLALLSVAKATG